MCPRVTLCLIPLLAVLLALPPRAARAEAPPPLTPAQKAKLKERDRLLVEVEKLYRAGKVDETLAAMAALRRHIEAPAYGVLGNHDSVRLVPGFEAMGIRMLLNEHLALVRGDQHIHLAGIDDAHYFWVDNIEKAAAGIPHDEFSILLSHTPEIYRQAAHADFNLLLGGHTHGGQICLPGAIPLTLDANLPRRFGAGPWAYHAMAGYTSVGCGSSVVPVRFNCPPEITLHRLERAAQ